VTKFDVLCGLTSQVMDDCQIHVIGQNAPFHRFGHICSHSISSISFTGEEGIKPDHYIKTAIS